MCKILTIINKNPKNNKIIENIITANSSTLGSEQSGYSVYRDNKTFNYAGKNAYDNFNGNIQYKGEKIYILHTRTKTAGADGIDGLHLQNIGGYVFAHNGTVTKYSTVTKKSDSYYFFKHLIRRYPKLDADAIEKHIKDTSFSGKGFLYNQAKKELIAFFEADGQITLLKDTVIMSSYEIETAIKPLKKNQILGYLWYTEGTEKKIKGIIHQEALTDLYLKFKNGTLIKRRKIDTSSTYNTTGMYSNSKYWTMSEKDQKEEITSQITDYLIVIAEDDLKGSKIILENDYKNMLDELEEFKTELHSEFQLKNDEIDTIVGNMFDTFLKGYIISLPDKTDKITVYSTDN